MNTFGGPGRNAYKGIALLQKPGTQQSDPYKMEPYRTLCRGHMIPAFVETMVSPMVKGGTRCQKGGKRREVHRVKPQALVAGI